MKILLYVLVLIIFSLCNLYNSNAQVTKLMGHVIDAKTKETMPFVSITFKGTKVGAITDYNGNYKLETTLRVDSIIASFIGYKRNAKKIIRNKFQTVNFEMLPSSLELNEVVVSVKKRSRTKDELALLLLDKILEYKDKNNTEKLNYYEYETYNKIEFDLNNITEEFKNKRVLKPFKFVFQYIDTSTVNGKPYLPVFIIESVADYYYRKQPKAEREYIKASHASGIQNQSINQLMGNMFIKMNLYDNYIDLFGKGFVSPVAGIGRIYYKYFLVDSAFIDNNWCYHMVFHPRIKEENVFNGDFWITDTTYAIKRIDIKIDKTVNINFINSVDISQEFSSVNNTVWMLDKETIIVDFNLFENPNSAMGFFGRKTTTFRNHKIDYQRADAFYATTTDILVDPEANNKDTTYWNEARHDELTDKEKGIFKMVDTIKSIHAFRTYYDIINAFVTYYYVWGKFELGPYFTTYSFNNVEGNRFKLGARTSNSFSKTYMLESYVAYGTKDERFKYFGKATYMFNKNPRRGLYVSYKHDVEQLGQSVNAFREDNILASALRRGPNNKLSMVNECKVNYEHEWFQGFSDNFIFKHREMSPVFGNNFLLHSSNDTYNIKLLYTTDFIINARFAYHEKFVMGEFERISLGTKYPVFNINYSYGMDGVWNNTFPYHKLILTVDHWFNIYPFGWSKYVVEAGKIFGTLPYPLLKMHEGNQTYFYDEYAFNLMNYYEFVSDQWLSLTYTHYFDGFFLNKFPLLRKLKWREVVWGKGLIGSIERKNLGVMDFPEGLGTLDGSQNIHNLKPYVEAGIGIENIFKVIRVDGVWRFSYLDNPNIAKWGIRVSMQFKF
ncbi:MAG: hypothetical protein A2X08_04010 [Bacteroidetes bacterium GWA2_32_17]|nr:MAG: hypothetical protein A2X08_04010 [Bacteroidetes bacterium GWA2_32_17]